MKIQKLLVRLGLVAVLLSTLNSQLSTAHAQGTAFTYQGRLDIAGVPASGTNDLTFTLYTAVTAGATVGTSNTFNDLVITNGLFTVTLDFGAGAFSGAARWLQIAARPGVSAGAYTNLAPRQAITPSPYAVFAGGAAAAGVTGTLPAGALSGTYSGVVNFSNAANSFAGNGAGLTSLNANNLTSGSVANNRLTANVALLNRDPQSFTGVNTFGDNVGIGTTTPNFPLSFGSSVANTKLALYDDGTFLYGLGVQGNQLRLHTASTNDRFSFLNGPSGTELFTVGGKGKVGIGTTTPNFPLSFPDSGGEKISLYGQDTNSIHGLGIGGNRMEFYVPSTGHSFDFGVGNNANFSAKMRVSGNGNVGIGTTTPGVKLDVAGVSQMTALELRAPGFTPYVDFSDTVNDDYNARIIMTRNGGAPALSIAGAELYVSAINLTSDRHAKEQFKPVSGRDVLAKVAVLPITEWQYKTQGDARHIGPMAQDFHAAFGTGRDDKHITSVDADGVALAAIQGLNEKLEEKSAEVEALKQSVAELKELVKQLAQPAGR